MNWEKERRRSVSSKWQMSNERQSRASEPLRRPYATVSLRLRRVCSHSHSRGPLLWMAPSAELLLLLLLLLPPLACLWGAELGSRQRKAVAATSFLLACERIP